MSVAVDYFFNSGKGLVELGREVGGCLGCALEPYGGEPSDLYARFLGMELSLSAADGYVNDGELDFESFGYELGVRLPVPDADLRPIAVSAMVMAAYVLHRRLGIAGMLVFDAQRLLARYEELGDEAGPHLQFDRVSGRLVDDFAEHLAEVSARLSEGFGCRYTDSG